MTCPRKLGNKDLPINLYRKLDKRTKKTYYTYRDPRNGKEHGFGTEKEKALITAHALNSQIYHEMKEAKIAAIVSHKTKSTTFEEVLKRHLELCEKRELSKNTKRAKQGLGNIWAEKLGKKTLIDEISVRHIVEILNTYDDRPRMKQALRSDAIDIWKDAIEEGWVKINIPAMTRAPSVKVKRSRLSIEDFIRIHNEAKNSSKPWIARSMELALATAQRREDIGVFEFRKSKNSTSWIEDDHLFVIQLKTGTRVRIPLSTSINRFVLSDIVKACRDNTMSKWLIHHQREHGNSKRGNQVFVDTITKGFAEMRDKVGVVVEEGKEPPSFHEIRSLAIRLYSNMYSENPAIAQAIAGHKDASTTDLYRDVRGSEWIQVKVG